MKQKKADGRELYKPSLSCTPFLVGYGARGYVFQVSGSHVAKVSKLSHDPIGTTLAWLAHENDIAQKAYAKGISVPEPIGIFDIELPCDFWTDKIVPGFVMEYIKGRRLSEIVGNELVKVKRRWKYQRDKARQSGFILEDDATRNAIWCQERERVYLVDFERWSYK